MFRIYDDIIILAVDTVITSDYLLFLPEDLDIESMHCSFCGLLIVIMSI